ncbi:MAG: hypothetical protein IJ493_09255 [Clostridia bacterium]|nr:hypothetical protein [Clostridia bacterium]
MKKAKKIILIVVSVLLLLAIIGGVGLIIYSKNGRYILGYLSTENVEKVTMTYTGCCGTEDREIRDYEVDISLIIPEVRNVKVTFPYERQNNYFYGGVAVTFTIYMKDGTIHKVSPLGIHDEYESTGYEVEADDGRYPIIKHSEYFLVEIDGVTYDTHDRWTYRPLWEVADIAKKQFHNEYGSDHSKVPS